MIDRAAVDGPRSQEPSDLRLLRALFDRLPALIAYWDRDGRNVVANAAYVEWFGFQPDQMRGLHISEVLGPEVYAKNLPFIQGALAGIEQLFDRTLVDQAGHTRHTQASYVPDILNGKVNGFFVLVTDVTPRVEAQRAMDDAQALARLGSWELVPETGQITWSRALFDIVGIDPQGDPPNLATLSEYIHPLDRARVLADIEGASTTGQPYTSDYRIVRTDGAEREVVSNGHPVLGPDGQVARINGTLQDVTKANQLARELATINDVLRRANELNADVIAMLGHDIRSPLGAVQGYLELLEEDWATLPEDERRALVSRARGSSRRLRAMLDQILALATIDSGAVNPAPVQLNLHRVITDLIDTSGLNGRVLVHADRAVTGFVDRVHLEQILGNLLTNALRYGEEPVRITARRTDSSVTISVSDAGPGVPAAQTSQLFTRFARTGPKQSAAGGTGFGLYMASKLAEANGGNLRYHPPARGHAHEFTLTIPATIQPAGAVE